MENNTSNKLFSDFDEGVLLGVQAATGKMIDLLQQNSHSMPPATLQQLTALFKIAASSMLSRRGLIPYRYDVIMGQEDVPLDFNITL